MAWNSENWQEQLENTQRLEALRRQQDQLDELKKQTDAIKSLERSQQQARIKADREARLKEIAELRVRAENKDLVAMDRLLTLLVASGESEEVDFWAAKAAKAGNVRAANILLKKELETANWKSIEEILTKVKQTDVFKETSFALTLGAIAHFIQGDLEKAKKELKSVIERKDLTETPLKLLELIAEAQSEQAENQLSKQATSDDADYVYSVDSALAAFAEFAEPKLSNGNGSKEDYYLSGLAMFSRNDQELFERYMCEASKLGNIPATYLVFKLYYECGEFDKALDISLELSTKDSKLAESWVNLANTYMYSTLIPSKKFDEVAELVKVAKRLNVLNQTTNAIGNGAISLYFQGKIDESIAEFKMALAREDAFSEAECSWWLSEIYEKTGDKESASIYKQRSKQAGGYKKPAFVRTFGKLEFRE